MKSRLSTCFIAALLVLSLSANSVYAASSRHAVLVYDANSHRVLYQENGTAPRFPASLTKMMTLYLLFDSLRSGKVTFNTKMTASQIAASQPHTNVSIRRGDTITVAQAINALVVRSANDISVVVAEHLGGSQANFANMMTNKARQLGMTNTVFKNPHGLPDARQHTTAMDMALLGAALRKHFPQYYHHFNTQAFTYKGVRYTGHNRVLNKLPGVDGIKTGYINASGFNLVSSLKRGNINIVAVILGGTTAGERDARMVSLLNRTYTKMAAEQGQAGTQIANAPTPTAAMAVSFTETAAPVQQNRFNVTLNAAKPAARANERTLDYQLASYSDTYPVPATVTAASQPSYADSNWAVQIGVFSDKNSATRALSSVAEKIRPDLANAVADVEYAQQANRAFHRARFKNMDRENANAVCQKLQQLHQDCFVAKVN